MRKKLILTVLMGMAFPYTGLAGILPHDLPTIEALIDQHKECMSAEDASNKQLAANATIKAMVKDVAKKYDEVKSTLDKKSGDALAYLSLAAEMSRCVTNTVKLTKEYSEFTRFAANHVGSDPMIAWYTLEANNKVYKELKNIRKMYLAVAATGTNFFRATNKERMNIIWTLNQSIVNMRDVIQQAYMWCDLLVGGYVHEDHIWEILNSSVLEDIGRTVINEWPV
ncbi:MAG: hypothetical protein J5932_07410 [Prevotella sp.]|nr:hypothetical protein [Prevotella sp.]MBP3845852.1 hypothetical protein [Prevotella sp.]